MIEVKNLTNDNVSDVSFTLRKGEVLGFAGLVGAGRTEVMRAIFGADPKESGDIYVNGKLAYGDMDPASRSGKTNAAADVRIEDVSPDGHGFINIKIKAKGAKDASLCGIVIE